MGFGTSPSDLRPRRCREHVRTKKIERGLRINAGHNCSKRCFLMILYVQNPAREKSEKSWINFTKKMQLLLQNLRLCRKNNPPRHRLLRLLPRRKPEQKKYARRSETIDEVNCSMIFIQAFLQNGEKLKSGKNWIGWRRKTRP